MDSAASWKRACFLLLALIVTQFFFLFQSRAGDNLTPDFSTTCDVLTERFREIAQQTGHAASFESEAPAQHDTLLPWDQLPLGADGEIIDNLSSAQCDYAFPDLSHEIDRATTYWRQREHEISPRDVNITWKNFGGDEKHREWGGAMRLLVHDNQIRVLEGVGLFDNVMLRTRGMQSLFLLHRAIESATAAGEVLPTVEIPVTVADTTTMPDKSGTETVWTWSRKLNDEAQQRHWLLPNFDMWRGVGNFSYRDSRLAAKQQDAPFRNKIPKLVWRGATWVNRIREVLVNMTAETDWADVQVVDGDRKEFFLDNDELCRYAMTIHTEGLSYSGRMKWLMSCNSLMFSHERHWDMYYYHLLQSSGPNQNYVEVKQDLSDLEEKVKYYLNHPEEAERIIANAVATFRDRYLTRAAVSCYIRKLIQGYSEVSFKPRVERPVSDEIRTARGMSYEAFMMMVHDVGDENS